MALPPLVKVSIYSNGEGAPWDDSIIEVHRVPMVGEYISVGAAFPYAIVDRVFHTPDERRDTVAHLVCHTDTSKR